MPGGKKRRAHSSFLTILKNRNWHGGISHNRREKESDFRNGLNKGDPARPKKTLQSLQIIGSVKEVADPASLKQSGLKKVEGRKKGKGKPKKKSTSIAFATPARPSHGSEKNNKKHKKETKEGTLNSTRRGSVSKWEKQRDQH